MVGLAAGQQGRLGRSGDGGIGALDPRTSHEAPRLRHQQLGRAGPARRPRIQPQEEPLPTRAVQPAKGQRLAAATVSLATAAAVGLIRQSQAAIGHGIRTEGRSQGLTQRPQPLSPQLSRPRQGEDQIGRRLGGRGRGGLQGQGRRLGGWRPPPGQSPHEGASHPFVRVHHGAPAFRWWNARIGLLKGCPTPAGPAGTATPSCPLPAALAPPR